MVSFRCGLSSMPFLHGKAMCFSAHFAHCSPSYNCLALPSLSSLKAENEVLFISKCIAYHTVGTEQTLDKCHTIKYQFLHEGCLAYYQLNMTFPDYKPHQHSAFTSLRAWSTIALIMCACECVRVYICARVWPPGQQGVTSCPPGQKGIKMPELEAQHYSSWPSGGRGTEPKPQPPNLLNEDFNPILPIWKKCFRF